MQHQVVLDELANFEGIEFVKKTNMQLCYKGNDEANQKDLIKKQLKSNDKLKAMYFSVEVK